MILKHQLEYRAQRIENIREEFRFLLAKDAPDTKNHEPIKEALDFLEAAVGRLRCGV